MAIHRFKCSDALNKEIMIFSDMHKFDSKENLIEQFDDWVKKNDVLIKQEQEFLQTNSF